MPPTQNQILEICRVVSECEDLNVTLNASAKGFFMAGTGALLGTLVGGPIGMFLGGSLGSGVAAYQSKNTRSVVDIINNDMTPDQKRKLVNSVVCAIQNVSPEDVMFILPLIMTTQSLRDTVVAEIITFVTKEMGMALVKR